MRTHTIASQLAKVGILFALTVAAAVGVTSSSATPGHAQRACQRVTLKGTVLCEFGYTPPAFGWIGKAIVSINGGEAATVEILTTGTEPQFKDDGTPYGHETNTLTFQNGSTLTLSGPWDSAWSGTPGLLDYYSVSKVTGGTGDFEGATGSVFTTGPFLIPFSGFEGVKTLYIGEMYGVVRMRSK